MCLITHCEFVMTVIVYRNHLGDMKMIRIKQLVLNNILLTASRPIHPLLLKYLSNKGCNIHIEDGYLIIDGNYSLPNKKELLAELITLSKEENNNEVIFDLDIQSSKFNISSFEIVDKKTNTVKKINSISIENYDQEVIDLLFAVYLLINDAVVYLDKNKNLCYMGGEHPIDQNDLIIEAKKFIIDAINVIQLQKEDTRLNHVNATTDSLQSSHITSELDTLLSVKYGLINNYQIVLIGDDLIYNGGNPTDNDLFNEKMERFIADEYINLQNKGIICTHPKIDTEYFQAQDPEESYTEDPQAQEPEEVYTEYSPGIFAAFSNWIFGSTSDTSKINNTQTPTPRP